MPRPLVQIINAYRPDAPLARAHTIPATWYTDPRDYVACELSSGDPILVARAQDDTLRGFFNVCRHLAAAVVTDGAGSARQSGVGVMAGRVRTRMDGGRLL